MTIDNEVLKSIAETLSGIQSELKSLNLQVARLATAAPARTEGPGPGPGRPEYRPNRSITSRGPSSGRFEKSGGPGKFDKGGPGKFDKGGPGKFDKGGPGKFDKSPRKPR